MKDYFMTPNEISNELQEFRANIDKVDDQLLILLNERAKIALEIAEYKRLHGLNIEDKGREKNVIEHCKVKNGGPLNDIDIEDIIQKIIQIIRELEIRNYPENT